MYKFPKKINGYKVKNEDKLVVSTVVIKNALCCYTSTNQLIGYLKWGIKDEYVYAIETWIDENYRRHGLGTAMYNAIRKATNHKLRWFYPLHSKNIEKFVQNYKIKYKDQIEVEDDEVIIFKQL